MKRIITFSALFFLLHHLQAQEGTIDPAYGNVGILLAGKHYTPSDGAMIGSNRTFNGFSLIANKADGTPDQSGE